MKKVLLLASLILGAVTLIGSPSGLNWSCVDGGSRVCNPGRVTFAGSGFPAMVHVQVVRNGNSAVYDNFDYDTSGGTLNFTETLVPADTYTVTVSGTGTTVSTAVTTSSSWGDDN